MRNILCGLTPLVTTVEEFPVGFLIPLKFAFHLLYTLPVHSLIFHFMVHVNKV